MATSFLTDLPKEPTATVTISDSKSTLRALQHGGTRNRHALQKATLHNLHQLRNRGLATALLWVPSHSGIRGNELADQAAKDATGLPSPINIGLSLSEATSTLKLTAQAIWMASLKKQCSSHGWFCLPGFRRHIPRLHRRHTQIICRIRTNSSPYVWKTQTLATAVLRSHSIIYSPAATTYRHHLISSKTCRSVITSQVMNFNNLIRNLVTGQ